MRVGRPVSGMGGVASGGGCSPACPRRRGGGLRMRRGWGASDPGTCEHRGHLPIKIAPPSGWGLDVEALVLSDLSLSSK